jgi:multiple sugar transport system permease protein
MSLLRNALTKLQGFDTRNPFFRRVKKEGYPYLLLLPTVLILVGLILYPIISAIDISFHDVSIMGIGRDYGPLTLKNYIELFTSSELWPSFQVSILYVLIVTIADYIIGLLTALLLNQNFRGRRIARLLIIIPWAFPLVVSTNIFWWIFNNTYGIANYFLTGVGLIPAPIDWFLTPIPALIAISVATLWKGYPMFTVMFLAGLQAIPKELYDATKVDGANARESFRYITMPALNGVAGIALLINSLWVFREFTVIFILTGGGPINATRTMAVWTYTEAFNNLDMGYAAAIGVLTMIIAVIASFFFVRATTNSNFYD